MNDRKKDNQSIWSLDLVQKKPFGYRVAHYRAQIRYLRYLLRLCPRYYKIRIRSNLSKKKS